MAIISIFRDTNNNVSLVRMIVTDTLSQVAGANYIKNNQNAINALNGGIWSWFTSDMILCSASNGNALFTFTDSTFSTLTEYSGTSSGVVNPGTINQLAWYAATGTTVSGLPTVNSASLSTNASGVPTWLALTDGKIVIGSSAGAPLAGNLSAGIGISIANGHNSITISSNGANPWVDETGASVTMAANTGYTSDDGASLVTFTLPASSAIGDWVEINGKGSGGWTIAQAAGQQIHVGNLTSTLGATGTLSSSNQYDCVRLRCLTANTIWTAVSVVGNLTIA